MTVLTERPPKDDCFRAISALVFRDDSPDDGAEPVDGQQDTNGVLSGHFAVFNSWTEICSAWEGTFLESIAPGAFTKTFSESRDQMRVLLQHGYDPDLGDKPIASILDLREDATGAYYEAELLDGLDPLVVAGLRAGQYGASFRFKVIREEWNEDPGVSDYNPKGLPERVVREVQVREFGPCTWGAYPDATAEMASATMRSVTDDWVFDRLTRDPDKLEGIVAARNARVAASAKALSEIRAAADGGTQVFVDTDGETYVVAEDGSVTERSWDDTELDAPAEADADARRVQEQEADAPPESGDTDDGTRPAKDYLAGATAPTWFIP